jgi:hypothetical protein
MGGRLLRLNDLKASCSRGIYTKRLFDYSHEPVWIAVWGGFVARNS